MAIATKDRFFFLKKTYVIAAAIAQIIQPEKMQQEEKIGHAPRREGRREPCRTGAYPWGAARWRRPEGWCGGVVGWRSRRRGDRGGRCRGGREVGRLLGPRRRHGPWGGRRWAWSATSCLWRRRRSPPRTDTPPPVPGCSGSSPDWAANASACAGRSIVRATTTCTSDRSKKAEIEKEEEKSFSYHFTGIAATWIGDLDNNTRPEKGQILHK